VRYPTLRGRGKGDWNSLRTYIEALFNHLRNGNRWPGTLQDPRLSPHWESRKCNEKTRKVQPIIVMRKQKIYPYPSSSISFSLRFQYHLNHQGTKSFIYFYLLRRVIHTGYYYFIDSMKKQNEEEKTKQKKRSFLRFRKLSHVFWKIRVTSVLFPPSFPFSLILFRRYMCCTVSHRALPALENPFLILRHSTMLSNANAVPINNTFKAIDYALPYIHFRFFFRPTPSKAAHKRGMHLTWYWDLFHLSDADKQDADSLCWRYRRPQAFDKQSRKDL
jgi:hypothetical protein